MQGFLSINPSCLLQPLPVCKPEPFPWFLDIPLSFFFATLFCWFLPVLSSFPFSQSFLSWDFRLEWCKWRKASLTVPLSPASTSVYKMHTFCDNFKLFDSSPLNPCVTHCLQNATLSFLIQVYLIDPTFGFVENKNHNYTLTFQF